MKQKSKKLAVLFVLTLALFAGAKQMNAEEPKNTNVERQLHEHAQRWSKQLAADPSFATWRDAELTIYPLGPGTHSWMVILTQANERVGYFIIQATEDGKYKLGEYGLDPYITYLDSFEQQASLLPGTHSDSDPSAAALQYVHPFLTAAASNSNDNIYELISGEELPVNLQQFTIETQNKSLKLKLDELRTFSENNYISIDSSLAAAVHLKTFDPFGKMPWLTSSAINENFTLSSHDKLQAQLIKAITEQKQLRYVTEQYSNKVLFAFSVTGYHQWDKQLFVELAISDYQTTKRYIPLSDLMMHGYFYR